MSGITSIAEAVSKLNVEKVAKTAESFTKDAEVLSSLAGRETPDLVRGIESHLAKEGKTGSAEYIGMFAKTKTLETEFDSLKAGKPVENGMIDTEQTTPEMLNSGHAKLKPNERYDMMGKANVLSSRLDSHVNRTAEVASSHYAEYFSNERPVAEKIKAAFGYKAEPYEIPLQITDEAEINKLEEITTRKFANKEEMSDTIRTNLRSMMLQNPKIIGLETTASTAKYLKGWSAKLSEITDEVVNVGEVTQVADFMEDQGLEELQIFPGFTQAIKESLNN
jgi:hypothetical protein